MRYIEAQLMTKLEKTKLWPSVPFDKIQVIFAEMKWYTCSKLD